MLPRQCDIMTSPLYYWGPLGVGMHVRIQNFKTCHFTNCNEEELAMYLSAFFYCFCFCLCRCCSFNPPSCCLLPYILICLTLSFQSHVVCWNFTLTGLHQCGHYGHLFLMYMLLSDSTKFRQLVYFTHLLYYQHWLLCNTIKMTFHCLCNCNNRSTIFTQISVTLE